MKTNKLKPLLLIFAVFCLLLSVYGKEGDNINQLWLDGYLMMSQAEKFAERGKNVQAVGNYRHAANVFTHIQKKYPDWNPQMVAFKLSTCRVRIEELQLLLNENAEEIAQVEATNHATEILALQRRILDLERQLETEQMKNELKQKSGPLAENARKEIAALLLAKQDLTVKVEELTVKLDECTRQSLDDQAKIQTLKAQLKDADTWARKGQASQALKTENQELKQALDSLNQTLDQERAEESLQNKNHKAIETLKKIAQDMEKQDDAANAARYWRAIVDKSPVALEPTLRAAYWFWRINDTAASIAIMDNYLKAMAPNTPPLILMGRVNLDEQQWNRALALTALAVAIAPDDEETHYALGTVFFAEGWRDLAEKCFRKAIQLNEKHGESLMALALLRASGNPPDTNEAKKLYQRAIETGQPRNTALEAVLP